MSFRETGTHLLSAEHLASTDVPYVFLEAKRYGKNNCTPFIFDSYVNKLVLDSPDDVERFFNKIQKCLDKGYWLAGFFSYEFGYCLEETLRSYIPRTRVVPLAWMGVFKKPWIFHGTGCVEKNRGNMHNRLFRIKNLKAEITRKEYNYAIDRIKKYIEEGQTYQVNFTFPMTFELEGDISSLYSYLCWSQPTPYLAFINTGLEHILSFSPELFFSVREGVIISRPMKGTIRRGRFAAEDIRKARELKMSSKNRAENIMIVDLIRNDLGRISKIGTVKTKNIFVLEKYPTLWQMTSTVEGHLREDVSIKDIFCAIFPCGSVTGAPKIRTMQIIRELERYPRGVYCGAIGYISPQRHMCFNVAIRTLHINREKKGVLGVGGGVVYDSVDDKEYEEAKLKATFLTKKVFPISLIETIRWDNNGYYLLDLHMKRLRNSSAYFNIPFRASLIERKLFFLAKSFQKSKIYKVRVVLAHNGDISCSFTLLERINRPVTAVLYESPVDSRNIYLYHKASHRDFYERARHWALQKGMWEVIFVNEKGEVTEGSRTNIFVLIGKTLFTPPVSCGLLGGVLREHLIQKKEAREKVIFAKDLFAAQKVYLGNSVRGLIECRIRKESL